MHVTKNNWLVATALLVVAGVILFTARRAEAQYSSPVRVMNTSSAPAINSSIDAPGRIPYHSAQGTNIASATNNVIFNFPAVPANHRLVVTQIDGFFTLNTTGIAVSVELSIPGSQATIFYAPVVGQVSAFAGPLLYYFDAGQTPQVLAYGGGGGVFINSQGAGLTGYLIDCSVAPCAAIAH